MDKFYSSLAKYTEPLARFSLFLVYFWFGILKVIGVSPAEQLVLDLHQKTLPFIGFNSFFITFSIFECVIGVLFLIKGRERLAFTLLVIHLITTAGPLLLLPTTAWHQFMVPTLIGQYIIKNIVLLAVAVYVVTNSQHNQLTSEEINE